MTKKEQRKLLRDIFRSNLAALLKDSGKWPKEWDGYELRALVADDAAAQATIIGSREPKHRRRLREYRNEKLVRGIW